MKKGFKKPTVIIALSIFIFSACGQDKQSVKFSKQTACEILTAQDASRVLGGPATRGSFAGGTQTAFKETAQCSYVTKGGATSDDVLSLTIQRSIQRPQSVEDSLNALQTHTYKGRKTTTIKGLGDGALLATTSTSQQLNVFINKDYFVISTGATKSPTVLEALARKISERLTKIKG